MFYGVLKKGSVSGKHDAHAAATASFSLPTHAGFMLTLSSARRLTHASPFALKSTTLACPRIISCKKLQSPDKFAARISLHAW